MSQLTLEEAREVIAQIREDNGGISSEDREAVAKVAPNVLRSLAKARRKAATATRILVNNLYSKDTRFLYELTQNAEDNSYSTAKDTKEKPFLTFRIHLNKIIIDSNEDGFSQENVEAICNVGESTKASSEGYIGEKGIGFKSVFKIAKKVHVQSGPFSFSFEYSRDSDGDGLGMVTPYDENAEELPKDVRTRMTLTFQDGTDYERLVSDFRSIPDTLLLFLPKLQILYIETHDVDEPSCTEEYSKREVQHSELSMTVLTKTRCERGEKFITEKKFYTMKSDVHNLPRDEARLDKKGNSIDRAAVILAFPVDKDDLPVLEQQHTFAFLPLRRVGFRFLIQSDFVTQANREDVVNTPRNIAVLSGVAEAFRNAMVLLCKHPTLRYQWMRYLPDDSVVDDFWKGLWLLIRAKLKETSLLEPWSGHSLYKPGYLERLADYMCDKLGNPLLPDLEVEAYLSSTYTERDFEHLKQLGTTQLTPSSLLRRLEADLYTDSSRPRSRWRCLDCDPDWRTRLCKLLLRGGAGQACLRTLELIPLHDGKWISRASRSDIYFPNTDGVLIPSDLGLDLVHIAAIKNDAWFEFLSVLGVITIPSVAVIDAIYNKYNAWRSQRFTLTNAVSHICYLYWFLPLDTTSLKPQIKLFGSRQRFNSISSINTRIYFPSVRDDYSPAELFKKSGESPGLEVEYLHDEYLSAVDASVTRNGRSFLLWLEVVAGVRWYPDLSNATSKELSTEFRYIIKHRSEKLLGVLERFRSQYRQQLTPDVQRELLRSTVTLENKKKGELRESYAPFPKLKHKIAELQVSSAFPFIATSELLLDEELPRWTFLQTFTAGIEDDASFYLRALQAFVELNPRLDSPSIGNELSQIYYNVQSKCAQVLDTVRTSFKMNRNIYVPPSGRLGATWVSASTCVWDAPLWLKSKQRLSIEVYKGLEPLFKWSLLLPNASLDDALEDLSQLKNREQGNVEIEEVERIYDYLWHNYSVADDLRQDAKNLVDAFEKSALVYVPHEQAWYPPSKCVWAEPQIQIPDRACIAKAYDHKKTFLTRTLKVLEPTVEMYIGSLVAEARKNAPAARLKGIMTLISSLGVEAKDVVCLSGAKVFPTKLANGQTCLSSANVGFGEHGFVIMDTTAHSKAFSGKIAALDFSIEDISDTRAFLLANGLDTRFSSKLVENVTTVAGGVPEYEITQSLRGKAQAIIRCAVHYVIQSKRPDIQSLYRTFRGVFAYLSDSIKVSTIIRQDNVSIEGTQARAEFHLEYEGGLRLYLPKEEVDRDLCMEYDLPRRLCEYLDIKNQAAIPVIGSVFRMDKPAAITRLLEKAGVRQVDFDFTSLEEELVEDDLEMKALIIRTRDAKLSTPSPEGELVPSVETDSADEPTVSFSSSTRQLLVTEETSYKKVLENVVDVARTRAINDIFEAGNPRPNYTSTIDALSDNVLREVFAARSQDRNLKLGAAGELYIYEYFKVLGLSDFGLDCWKSTIRHYVKLHPDYREIENIYDRSALTDFEYDDKQGKLTQFLVRKGHLDATIWADKCPFYCIEVKATTSANWQEPFHMSKAQYRDPSESNHCAIHYIVCRVFNLGKGDKTGLNIYLDPDTKRENGELRFTADTWSVTPLWYLGMPNWRSQARSSPTVEVSSPPSVGIGSSEAQRNKAVTVRLPTPDRKESSPERSLPGDSSGTIKPVSNNEAQDKFGSNSMSKTISGTSGAFSNVPNAFGNGETGSTEVKQPRSFSAEIYSNQPVFTNPSVQQQGRAIAVPRSLIGSKRLGAKMETGTRATSLGGTPAESSTSAFLFECRFGDTVATASNPQTPPAPTRNDSASWKMDDPSPNPPSTSSQGSKPTNKHDANAQTFLAATERQSSSSLSHVGSHTAHNSKPRESNLSESSLNGISSPPRRQFGPRPLLRVEDTGSSSFYNTARPPPIFPKSETKGTVHIVPSTLFHGDAPFFTELEIYPERLNLNYQSLTFAPTFSGYSFEELRLSDYEFFVKPQPQHQQPTSYVAKTTLFAGSAPFCRLMYQSIPPVYDHLQSITAKSEYRHSSFEELRLRDYEHGLKFKSGDATSIGL